MVTILMTNPSGKVVGTYDTEKKTYYRIVNRNQQFVHPKYEGQLALSRSILKELIKLGCERFQWTLMEWEEQPFRVIITIKDFLKNMEPLYFKGKENSDRQYGVRLNFWTRRYADQAELPQVIEMIKRR